MLESLAIKILQLKSNPEQISITVVIKIQNKYF